MKRRLSFEISKYGNMKLNMYGEGISNVSRHWYVVIIVYLPHVDKN